MIGCQNKNQFNFIVKNPGNQPLIELQNTEAENRLHPLSMSSKMKSKYFPKFLFAILLAFLLSAIPTFSVGFTKGTSRDAWWYDLGNGNYLRSTWQWIDSDSDGVAECRENTARETINLRLHQAGMSLIKRKPLPALINSVQDTA